MLLYLSYYMMMVTVAQTTIFLGRGRFFKKHFNFDTRKKDRAVEDIVNFLKFLFLEEFQPQSYEMVLIKKS